MNKLDILEIHDKYSDNYKDYNLIGSYSLFVPFYKFECTYEYLKETKLTLIEEYICKAIYRGINNIKEISFVLAISEDIIEFYVKQLVKLEYLTETNLNFNLTEEAKVLYEQFMKMIPEKGECSIYFNTLQGNYISEITELETDHDYMSYREANKDENSIILEPRIIDKTYKEHLQSIKKAFLNNLCGIKGINNINILEQKDIVYHNVSLLLYKNKDKYKILCYDNCGYYGVDNSITKTLQKLYENKELYEILKENTSLNGISMEEILMNYEKELELIENDERKEIIQDIKQVVKEIDTLQYIMNYEIRKKFLFYLENAKESLYIISPWMNNYIINNEFIDKLEELLKRKVKVRIIYGISNMEEIKDDFRNRNTMSIANKLKNMANPYGDLFRIEHGQTHEKLVICDRKYYINGSFNFLSYSGEKEGKFRNEGSTYSENLKLINQTIKLRFNE